MREIKFRAWDGKKFYPSEYELIKNICFSMDGFVNGIIVAKFRPDGDFDFEQIDAELIQYTGLKDKKGIEIYEGDIVKCNNGHIGVIEFEEHDCCFNVTDYYCSSNDYPTMAFIEGQPFEVIGNIYENPELLKDNQ